MTTAKVKGPVEKNNPEDVGWFLKDQDGTVP